MVIVVNRFNFTTLWYLIEILIQAPSRSYYRTRARIRIDTEERRVLYLGRLEGLMEELDEIIADPVGFERIQLDAMKVLIRAVRMCYSIVRDVDVKLLEDELEGLKEDNRRAAGARGELGYEIER